MPRPHKCRRVDACPRATVFKPAGVPADGLESVALGLDELEALRLADVEGLYHDAAAERMGISRATFGRVVQSARRKVATALVEGRMLVVEGGKVTVRPADQRVFIHGDCAVRRGAPLGTDRPAECSSCSVARACGDDGERCRRRRTGGGRRGRGRARDKQERGRSVDGPRPPTSDKGE